MTMNLELLEHVTEVFKEEIVSYFTTGFEDEGKTPMNEVEIDLILYSLDISSYARDLIKWTEEQNADPEEESVDPYKVEYDIYREILHKNGVYDICSVLQYRGLEM